MLSFEAVKDEFNSLGVEFTECDYDGDKVIITYFHLKKTQVGVEIAIRFEEDASICNIYVIELAKVEYESKQYYQMLKLCNNFNINTNYVQMYIKDDGTVWAQITLDMIKFNADELRLSIMIILNMLDSQYISEIMKIRWDS